jgi:hypothetical protein
MAAVRDDHADLFARLLSEEYQLWQVARRRDGSR